MPLIVYNLSILLALVLIAVGSGAQWGWPIGCIVTGVLVIAFTFTGLLITQPRKKG